MSKNQAENQFFLVSLGCSKNTVDSQSISTLLVRDGYRNTTDSADASVLIVNTCGFINSAKQESLTVLRELASEKRTDQLLIAAGCLSQRYGEALVQEVPGIDGVLGTRRWMDIVPLVRQIQNKRSKGPIYHLPNNAYTVGRDEQGVLRAAIQGASAYLKISDGCRRPCAFCAIPKIKGTLVSRSPETIVREAVQLQNTGIQEIILISQDTTDYGHDLGMKNGLSNLLKKIIAAAPDVPWIRIMYAYPGYVTDELIETMAKYPQILPYIDMPLQHANRETLKRMRRPANVDWVYRCVDRLRSAIPELAIRTTFIVGYPGETAEEFESLKQFIREIRFDRVGIFAYSYEESTPSATITWHVSDSVKEARRAELMALQQQISLEINQKMIGQTLSILVEGNGDGISIGRSYRDAPEIDGLIIVPGELAVGKIVPVRIDGAMTYDLTGTRDINSNIIVPELQMSKDIGQVRPSVK
jgi:ribosomal protein S12 methylthiotransferase